MSQSETKAVQGFLAQEVVDALTTMALATNLQHLLAQLQQVDRLDLRINLGVINDAISDLRRRARRQIPGADIDALSEQVLNVRR